MDETKLKKVKAFHYYSRNTQRVPLIIRERLPLIGNGEHYWNQNSTFKFNIIMFQR